MKELVKSPHDSLTIMTEMVMPNDTNPLGNLMGGNLLRWMDVAGGICSRRHANRVCVTASVDSVSFDSPIRLGEIVTIVAKVTRVFNTSMEVHIEVHTENQNSLKRRRSNEAYLTFVGVDDKGKKVLLEPLQPETKQEWTYHEMALKRREMRLIISGRMKAQDSKALKDMFLPKK